MYFIQFVLFHIEVEHNLLFTRQLPVRLAFVMSINKSQEQSVHYVGLDLQTVVSIHEQLYVALSQCTSAQRIKVLFPEGKCQYIK